MAVVYLIRHGQASFGKANYDQLSDLGHQQSIRLGLAWAERLPMFDKVYLGSMLRHKQTANNCLTAMKMTMMNHGELFLVVFKPRLKMY